MRLKTQVWTIKQIFAKRNFGVSNADIAHEMHLYFCEDIFLRPTKSNVHNHVYYTLYGCTYLQKSLSVIIPMVDLKFRKFYRVIAR